MTETTDPLAKAQRRGDIWKAKAIEMEADRDRADKALAQAEQRAAALDAVVARLRQMTDHWEQQLPEVIRTPAVVSAIRAALERAETVPSVPADRAAGVAEVIRIFPFDNFGMDDVSFALEDDPEAQEWVPALADAVLATLPATTARAVEVRDYWHAEAMSATTRIIELEGQMEELRRTADETPQPEAPDVVAAIVSALRERAGELSELAEEEMRPSLEERAQEWHEAADVARRAAKAAVAAPAPFTPPAHYRRDDGVDCCVHTSPVGPDSCPACRELHDDDVPAVGAQQPKEADWCSAVALRVHHAGHDWTPQPGMATVHCVGYPQPKEA